MATKSVEQVSNPVLTLESQIQDLEHQNLEFTILECHNLDLRILVFQNRELGVWRFKILELNSVIQPFKKVLMVHLRQPIFISYFLLI